MKSEQRNLAAVPSTALLACPFCGHEAKWAGEKGEHFILCANAHCHMEPVTHSYWTEAEALAAWNTRADSKANPSVLVEPPPGGDNQQRVVGSLNQDGAK